jgi:hypothetical protein
MTEDVLTPPKVFISYTHDSNEHADRVLDLANRLRRDGIDADVDQYIIILRPKAGRAGWKTESCGRILYSLYPLQAISRG